MITLQVLAAQLQLKAALVHLLAASQPVRGQMDAITVSLTIDDGEAEGGYELGNVNPSNGDFVMHMGSSF